MKFAQLKAGQAFIWKERQYLKVTPLMAVAEDGEDQQLIPRSAEVTLAGGAGDPQPPPREDVLVSLSAVREAFDDFQQAVESRLDDLRTLPPEQASSLIRSLALASRKRIVPP